MKAVFLDAGGVLYRRERHYRHLLAFLGRQQLPLPSPSELRRIRAEIKSQRPGASRSVRHDAFLAVLGVFDLDPVRQAEGRRVLAQESAEITLFPGVAETLRALAARGFKLGVITNTTTPTAQKRRWLQSCGVDVPWDSFVSSCEVGVAKPHPRIYEIALAQCAVAPAEGVFVGHDATELAGARAVGLKTVGFDCGADARADDFIVEFADLLELPYLRNGSVRRSNETRH